MGREPYNPDVTQVVLHRILTVLAWAGVFVAGFLTVTHYMDIPIPCSLEGACDAVTRHPAGTWLGQPVSLFGLLAYLTLAGIAAARTFSGFESTGKLNGVAFAISALGFLLSGYFMFTAFLVIGARCDWCVASAAIMTLSFVGYAIQGYLASNGLVSLKKRVDETLMGACAILALGGVGAMTAMNVQKAKGVTTVIEGDDGKLTYEDLAPNDAYFVGPEDAPVKIVEFADFFCPGCRSTFEATKNVIGATNGKVRFGYRSFPLTGKEGHEFSLPAAMASEYAADQGKYWEFVDLLFSGEADQWRSLEAIGAALDSLGMNGQEFLTIISDESSPKRSEYIDRVSDGRSFAIKIGVNGTPSYVIFFPDEKPLIHFGSLEDFANKPENAAKLGISGGPSG